MAVSEQLEQFEQMLTRLGNSPEDKRLEQEVSAVLARYEGVPSAERVRAVMGGVRYGVQTLRQLRDLGLHLSGPNYTQLASALVHRLDAELSRPEAAALPAWMHDLFVQELRMWLPSAANTDLSDD